MDANECAGPSTDLNDPNKKRARKIRKTSNQVTKPNTSEKAINTDNETTEFKIVEGEVEDMRTFDIVFTSAQVIGIATVALVYHWVSSYGGGLNFDPKSPEIFNWHPLLTIVGFSFILGNGLMVYRFFRIYPLATLKLSHGLLQTTVLVLVGCAHYSIYQYRNNNQSNGSNSLVQLYTLHSWLGALAVGLLCLQWIIGVTVYVWPKLEIPKMCEMLSAHVTLGIVTFNVASVATISGCLELAITKTGFRNKFNTLTVEVLLINVIAMMSLAFTIIVTYIVSQQRFRRYSITSDCID